jgi:hypothetical protein
MPYVRHKRTGEMVYVPDQQPPADPTFPYQGPKAQADVKNTEAGTTRTEVQTQGDILENENKVRTMTQNPISDKDQALINKMRLDQGDLSGVLQDITAAQAAVDRFKPAPGRGSAYSWAVPEDDDMAITAWLKNRVGDIAGLSDEDRNAYQTLLGLQNQSVLNSQIEQKGPQTESDAARMKLAGISPNKGIGPNAVLLAEQQYDVLMKKQRPSYYEKWANKYGSTHALNKDGKTVDEVWNDSYLFGLEKMRNGPGYRRAAGKVTLPPRKDTGWKIERIGD